MNKLYIILIFQSAILFSQDSFQIPENYFYPSISAYWGMAIGAQPIWPSAKVGITAEIGPVYSGLELGFGGMVAAWGSINYYLGLTYMGATLDYSWAIASYSIGAPTNTVQSQNINIGLKLFDGRFGMFFLTPLWFRTGIMLDYDIINGNGQMYANSDYPKIGDKFLTFELFYIGTVNQLIYDRDLIEINWWIKNDT